MTYDPTAMVAVTLTQDEARLTALEQAQGGSVVAPTISPTSGDTATTFTATDTIPTGATNVVRGWFLNGNLIGSANTITSASAGALVRRVSGSLPLGGTFVLSSNPVTVSGSEYTPAMQFNDARNSMYLGAL